MELYIALCLLFLGVRKASSLPKHVSFIHETLERFEEETIHLGCPIAIEGIRSAMDCARRCWSDVWCLGAGYNTLGGCVHRQLCLSSIPACPRPDLYNAHHSFMVRYCVHGSWDSSTKSCVCSFGTYGHRCHRYYGRCRDLFNVLPKGRSHDVLLDPLLERKCPIFIRCYISTDKPQKCHAKIFKNRGGTDFNRTWDEYVNGFYQGSGLGWIGLKAFHLLGRANCQTLFLRLTISNGGRLRGSVNTHGNFIVKGEDHGYSMTFQTARVQIYANSGFKQDCLGSLKGVPFSTWDRDKDGNAGENCASLVGSGWWYKDGCDNPCNLMGWGLDNYSATPPEQRLSFVGLDIAQNVAIVKYADMFVLC